MSAWDSSYDGPYLLWLAIKHLSERRPVCCRGGTYFSQQRQPSPPLSQPPWWYMAQAIPAWLSWDCRGMRRTVTNLPYKRHILFFFFFFCFYHPLCGHSPLLRGLICLCGAQAGCVAKEQEMSGYVLVPASILWPVGRCSLEHMLPVAHPPSVHSPAQLMKWSCCRGDWPIQRDSPANISWESSPPPHSVSVL